MKTSKPISTINYTSHPFLIDTLNDLLHRKVISFWFFVHHLCEDDQKKEHDHLFIELAHLIQTEDLRENFRELDVEHPDLPPITVMPFRSSTFEDAYLYFIHDPDYLASKGLSRKHHYTRSQVVTSDDDYLDELIRTIDRTKFNKYGDMRKAIASGENFYQYLQHTNVPLQMFNVYKNAFETLMRGATTFRNGRPNSESKQEDKRTWTCTSCGSVVGEGDAVIRKGNLCTCRFCQEAQRRKNKNAYLFPDYTIISTEKGFLDISTGKFVDADKLFDKVEISPELDLAHKPN